MPCQSSLPRENSALFLHIEADRVEADQAPLSQDVAARRSNRFLWSTLGFTVFMLIWVSACVFVPRALQASAETAHILHDLAAKTNEDPLFAPSLPLPRPTSDRSSISTLRPAGRPVVSKKSGASLVSSARMQSDVGDGGSNTDWSAVDEEIRKVIDPEELRTVMAAAVPPTMQSGMGEGDGSIDWSMERQMLDPEEMRKQMAAAVSQKGRTVPEHLRAGNNAAQNNEAQQQLTQAKLEAGKNVINNLDNKGAFLQGNNAVQTNQDSSSEGDNVMNKPDNEEVFEALFETEKQAAQERQRDMYTPSHLKFKGKLREDGGVQFVWVDEPQCIGCTLCATVARNTFFMEESAGRARVFSQGSDVPDVIAEAIDCCPVSCIRYVDHEDLVILESERDGLYEGQSAQNIPSNSIGTSKGDGYLNKRVANRRSRESMPNKNLIRCGNCPSRGCRDCPMYGVGLNPIYIERLQAGTIRYSRSQRIEVKSGEAAPEELGGDALAAETLDSIFEYGDEKGKKEPTSIYSTWDDDSEKTMRSIFEYDDAKEKPTPVDKTDVNTDIFNAIYAEDYKMPGVPDSSSSSSSSASTSSYSSSEDERSAGQN